jgi:hypothetical protein
MINEIEKETRELTPQEVLFCDAYADAESETYGNATESAKLAKYTSPHNAAWKLKQRPAVRDRLSQIYEKNKANIGKVMSDLEHERLLAIKKGDLSTAVRCSELQGKRYGAFSDRFVISADEQPKHEMSPEKEAELDAALNDYYSRKYLAVDKTIETELQEGDPVHPHTPPSSTSSSLAE